jgi:carbon starvation protein
VVFAGAVQDFVILFCSMRRDGRSLGEMVKMEMGPIAGGVALVGTLGIMIIILAALGLVVVKALGESPWGTFTVAITIPTAMLMGVYMRSIRPGKVGKPLHSASSCFCSPSGMASTWPRTQRLGQPSRIARPR